MTRLPPSDARERNRESALADQRLAKRCSGCLPDDIPILVVKHQARGSSLLLTDAGALVLVYQLTKYGAEFPILVYQLEPLSPDDPFLLGIPGYSPSKEQS